MQDHAVLLLLSSPRSSAAPGLLQPPGVLRLPLRTEYVLRITTALDDLQPRPITGSPAGPRPLGQRGNVGPGTNQSLRQTRYSVLQILQENPRIYVRSSYGVYSWTQKEYRGTNTPYVRRSSLADYHDYHQTEFSPRIRIRRGLTSVFLVGRGGGNSDHHPPCRSREHGWDRLVGWLG